MDPSALPKGGSCAYTAGGWAPQSRALWRPGALLVSLRLLDCGRVVNPHGLSFVTGHVRLRFPFAEGSLPRSKPVKDGGSMTIRRRTKLALIAALALSVSAVLLIHSPRSHESARAAPADRS